MNINKLIDEVKVNRQVELEDMPELDLYMDQVIQLFETKMEGTKRTQEDKILTKTMINNYAKGKLLMPIKNKKYSKEHIILISLIYNYKGTISIGDIKLVLDRIVADHNNEEKEIDIREIYNLFLKQCEFDSKLFEEESKKIIEAIKIKSENDYDNKLLLLSSLINMSNMYRRLSEKLIDEYFMEE